MTSRPIDPAGWARENLFKTWKDAALTVVVGAVLAFLAYKALSYYLAQDWEIVQVNMRNFLLGPEVKGDDVWGPIGAVLFLTAVVGVFVGAFDRRADIEKPGTLRDPLRPSHWREIGLRSLDRFWPVLLLVLVILLMTGSPLGWAVAIAVPILGFLARGVGARLPDRAYRWVALVVVLAPVIAALAIHWFFIDWNEWGGLLLVSFAGAAGIALSFPLGLLLALGRRSKLPVMKWISVAYIEFFRGVPLVVFLFVGTLVIGLLLPQALLPSKLIRVIIILTLFTAAYIAEIVRGGLQSLPSGQEEAAKAVGLPAWRITSFIVLPQALRNVIPALVGQAISLWKDTSLLFIVGFSELLGIARAVTQQPDFRGDGLLPVTLLFAGAIYWVVSFTMSRESQRLERKLGVGER